MSECVCLRCGFKWHSRPPWSYETGYKKNHVPVRCASCRSPLWNKAYVRHISPEHRNAGSHFDALSLPLLAHAGLLPSHVAGGVRINKLSLSDKSRVGRAAMMKRKPAQRRRAAVKAVKTKHGKSKGKKCQD